MKIVLNDDKELVKKLREQLAESGGYCPCALERNEETKCMCREFREMEHEGYCHCGMYYKCV